MEYSIVLDKNESKFSSYYSQLTPTDSQKEPEIDACPECGCEISRNGRCRTCYCCGWSTCDL